MSTISSLTNKCIKYTLADKDQELAIPSLKLLDELSNGVDSSIGNINDELKKYYKKVETSSDLELKTAFDDVNIELQKKIESSDISFIYDEQEKTLGLSAFGNKIASIDCTQFIKDGMLSAVKLSSDNVLWMYFNVDGNTEPISIDMQQINDTYSFVSSEGTSEINYQLQKKTNKSDKAIDIENGKIVIPKYTGQTAGTIATFIDQYYNICADINPGVIKASHLAKELSDYIDSIKEIADAATTSSEVEQIADSYVQPILNDYTTSAQAGTIAEQFMTDLSVDVYENEDNGLHTKLFTNQRGFLVGSLPKDKNTYYKDSQVVYYTKSTIQKVDCDKDGNITNTYFDFPLSSGRLLVDTDDYTTSAEANKFSQENIEKLNSEYKADSSNKYISSIVESNGIVSAEFGEFPSIPSYNIKASINNEEGKTEYNLEKDGVNIGATIDVLDKDEYSIVSVDGSSTITYKLQKKINGVGDPVDVENGQFVFQKYFGSGNGTVNVIFNNGGPSSGEVNANINNDAISACHLSKALSNYINNINIIANAATTSSQASSIAFNYATKVSSHISVDYYRKNETSSTSQLTEKFNSYVPLSIAHDVDVYQAIAKDGMLTIRCEDGAIFRVDTDRLEAMMANGMFYLKAKEDGGAGEIQFNADENKSELALNSLNVNLLGSNTATVSADSSKIYLNDISKTLKDAIPLSTSQLYNDSEFAYLSDVPENTKLWNNATTKYLDGDLNYYSANNDYWTLSGNNIDGVIKLYKTGTYLGYKSEDGQYRLQFMSGAWRFHTQNSDNAINDNINSTHINIDNGNYILDKHSEIVFISKAILSSDLSTINVSEFINDIGYATSSQTSNIVSTYVRNTIDSLSTIESTLTGSEVLNSISETSGKISITKRNLSAVDLDGISSLVSTIASSYYDALSNDVYVNVKNALHTQRFTNEEGFEIGPISEDDPTGKSVIWFDSDKITKETFTSKDDTDVKDYEYPMQSGTLLVDADISNYVKIDKELSLESENPVQNKVITKKIAERDYTGFQVWPTATAIAIGTALSDLAPIKDRKDFFGSDAKLSVILTSTVKTEIPANDTQFFTLRCNSGKADLSTDNIYVDWGDGTTTTYNDMLVDPVLSTRIIEAHSDNGGIETDIIFSHDYNVEDNDHIFDVKIYGNKNFGIKDTNSVSGPESTNGKNLICRCMDNEYPIASNFVNLTDFCKDSYKLFIMTLPNYSHMFDGVQNASRTFQDCKNLLITHNFNDQFRFCRLNCFFKGCENMITTDIIIPAFITVQQYNQIEKGGDSITEMFNGCKNLEKDVNEILPPNGFMARRINIGNLFRDCAKLTCSVSADMTDILWDDTSKSFKFGDKHPFAGASQLSNIVIESWR